MNVAYESRHKFVYVVRYRGYNSSSVTFVVTVSMCDGGSILLSKIKICSLLLSRATSVGQCQ